MSDRDLEGKLRTAAESWNVKHNVAMLIDAVWALDASRSVSDLTKRTVRQH